MARGFPDYFGRSIWPKFGTANSLAVPSFDIASGDTQYVIQISGMGVLTYLRITIELKADFSGSSSRLRIDGASLGIVTLRDVSGISMFGGARPPWAWSMFDYDYGYAEAQIGFEMPFHDSVDVDFTNGSVDPVGVSALALYYIVE